MFLNTCFVFLLKDFHMCFYDTLSYMDFFYYYNLSNKLHYRNFILPYLNRHFISPSLKLTLYSTLSYKRIVYLLEHVAFDIYDIVCHSHIFLF